MVCGNAQFQILLLFWRLSWSVTSDSLGFIWTRRCLKSQTQPPFSSAPFWLCWRQKPRGDKELQAFEGKTQTIWIAEFCELKRTEVIQSRDRQQSRSVCLLSLICFSVMFTTTKTHSDSEASEAACAGMFRSLKVIRLQTVTAETDPCCWNLITQQPHVKANSSKCGEEL